MNLVHKVVELPVVAPLVAPIKFKDAAYLDVMCHEIGTPLTAIIGLSHILSDVDCTAQQKTECAEMLRDSAHMLMGLMKNMLDSSRLDAGMVEIEDINFSLAKVVQEAVHIVSTMATAKGLKLNVHISNLVPLQYSGDQQRLRQILVNLLSNAVKFTETGEITLYLSGKKDAFGHEKLCFTVADTGIGISKEQVEKVFTKYAQANAGISRKYGGNGLGLSISQDLAHLMQGDIAVKSWPGMGSHFILTLPLHKTLELLAVV